MKDAHLHRMNFLKRARFGFTFRDMVYTIAAWYLLLMMFYGIEALRIYGLERRIDTAKATLVQLTSEKDRQAEIAKTSIKSKGGVTKENLGALLMRRPRWSKVLKGIVQIMPADVWLDEGKVTGGDDQWYTIEVSGKARSQQSLSDFIMRLETSGDFLGTSLENTGQPGVGEKAFTFDLKTQPSVQRLLTDG
jgi:Tfp pilus assembly protein PilN